MIAEIKFECAHCGQKIAVGSEAAGLAIECPTCQNPVTIPHDEPAPELRRKDGGLRDKLAALQSECERLRANATHSQAEIKSFQNERHALKQRAAAAEAQLGEAQLVRQRLEATETQLSTIEQDRTAALRELERVRGELATSITDGERLRSEYAAASTRLAESESFLVEARAAVSAAQAEIAALQTRFATASGEADSLRGLMDRDTASRELLSIRTKLATAEDELQMRRQSATQLEMDLLKAEAERDRLDAERVFLHRQIAESLKQAEELSADRIHADNAKLRELLERQNEELKLRFRELTRFRRAKLALRIIWALTFLGAIGLGFLFVKILPTIEWAR